MENPLNETANAAYEQRMIDLKLKDRERFEAVSRSLLKRAWDLLPESVRRSRALQKAKAAHLGSKAKAEHQYARVCMMSFMNYMLNRTLELPANADGEYLAGAKKVLEQFIPGASGGPLSQETLYGKQLYDRIESGGGHYEFEGKRLGKNVFAPEVFLHHHGLKLLPKSIVSQVRQGSILDVGAGMGDSAVVLSDYTDGNVYSFECDDANLDPLVRTPIFQKGVPLR
jgi:hypothetical protein